MRSRSTVVLAAALMLTGCAGTASNTAGPATPATTTLATASSAPSSPTAVVSPTVTATGTPTPTTPPGYNFDCYPPDELSKVRVSTLDEVWAGNLTLCESSLDSGYEFTSTDKKAIALYQKDVPDETAYGALTVLLDLCADYDEAEVEDLNTWGATRLTAALLLCPKAPHAPTMRAIANSDVFTDGNWIVGKDLKPGKYRTDPEVSDCYWERLTASGKTIDNDFVSWAPKGATVTIRSSDGGFSSEDCGTWHRIK